jgi:hypothetical protein
MFRATCDGAMVRFAVKNDCESDAVLSSHESKIDSESYVDKMDMNQVEREHPRGHVLQVKQ